MYYCEGPTRETFKTVIVILNCKIFFNIKDKDITALNEQNLLFLRIGCIAARRSTPGAEPESWEAEVVLNWNREKNWFEGVLKTTKGESKGVFEIFRAV